MRRRCTDLEISIENKIGKLQVRESDQLSYPVRQVASLDMVPERTPCPPASVQKSL